MYRYIWLVPLLPLLGAAVNGLLGRRLRFSERVVGAVGVGSVALAFVISLAAVVSYGVNVWPRPYVTSEDGAFSYTWIPGGAVELTGGRAERAQAAGASAVARGQGASLVLVMGSNFMLMFVGWEGVGLCSYLLIGYYFDRKEAGDASRKAFITNRVG